VCPCVFCWKKRPKEQTLYSTASTFLCPTICHFYFKCVIICMCGSIMVSLWIHDISYVYVCVRSVGVWVWKSLEHMPQLGSIRPAWGRYVCVKNYTIIIIHSIQRQNVSDFMIILFLRRWMLFESMVAGHCGQSTTSLVSRWMRRSLGRFSNRIPRNTAGPKNVCSSFNDALSVTETIHCRMKVW
jgi:hypothetical protein